MWWNRSRIIGSTGTLLSERVVDDLCLKRSHIMAYTLGPAHAVEIGGDTEISGRIEGGRGGCQTVVIIERVTKGGIAG